MKFTELPLESAFKIDPDKRVDSRGFFARTFCAKEFTLHGLSSHWVQMNTSFTHKKGTIRGMHFQRPPNTEAKIIRCLSGSIWDVIVDIRSGSKTFSKWFGIELNEKNRTMLYVPEGFAHGFQTLTENVELLYMHSEFYNPELDSGLSYEDEILGIKWPLSVTEISQRDAQHLPLNQLDTINL